jgi:hypothetical protein
MNQQRLTEWPGCMDLVRELLELSALDTRRSLFRLLGLQRPAELEKDCFHSLCTSLPPK